jgi:beta-phosphoglucomutase-like phosphatase (HAD superfamily)
VTAQLAKKSNRLRCDGTLIDSVDLHPRAWQKAFSAVGKQIPYAKLRAQIGKGADLLVPYFVNQEELERFGKKISKRQEQIFKKIYSSQIPFASVPELFDACERKVGRWCWPSLESARRLIITRSCFRSTKLTDLEVFLG